MGYTAICMRTWGSWLRGSDGVHPGRVFVFPGVEMKLLALLLACTAFAQNRPVSGRRVRRLLIHNATVVDGNGTPASGPKDIVIENNTIAEVIALDPVAVSRAAPPGMGGRGGTGQADAGIDATGKYVLPGLINAHAHLHEERGGKPQPIE